MFESCLKDVSKMSYVTSDFRLRVIWE